MTDAPIPGLTRHFVTVGERQLHYRRMGSGPALVMIHRLPRSSADLVSFMQDAAQHFTVIAPDLAGYGNSWQLFLTSSAGGMKIPTIMDYVDDIDEMLKEIGVQRAFVYGEHIGAMAALQLAIRDPKRVAGAVLNGLVVTMTEADKTEARASYNLPFEPRADGSHWPWLWSSLREENLFYPPWTKTAAARLEEDMPPPEKLQARLLQFLAEGRNPFDNARHLSAGRKRTFTTGRLGRGYGMGYLAALDFKPIPHLANLAPPTLITGTKLFQKDVALARVATKSAVVEVKQAESLTDARAQALAFFAPLAGKVPPPPPAPTAKPIAGGLWSDFITIPGGQIYATMNDDVPTVPLIIAHDAGGSVATVEPVIRSVVGRRTVLAFDLPGAGESEDTLAKENLEIDHYAEVIRTILNTFGLIQVDFFGLRGGGFVGLDLALKDKSLVRRLIMASLSQHDGDDLAQMEANVAPDLSPQWHGGHLLQAWHQVRDQALYYPWFDRTRTHVVKREPQLDVNALHTRTCSLLKAGDNYRAAALAQARYRTYEKLAQSPVPTVIGTTKWDPNNTQTEEAAKKVASPNCRLRYLDEDFGKWGESFLEVLEDADRKG